MSPEHALGNAVDARSDVFASGILLWELLAGRRLYRAQEGLTLLDQAKKAEFAMPPARGFAGETVLHEILTKALAPEPKARFATAGEMATALEDFCATHGIQPSAIRFGEWLRSNFDVTTREASRPILTPGPRPYSVTRALTKDSHSTKPSQVCHSRHSTHRRRLQVRSRKFPRFFRRRREPYPYRRPRVGRACARGLL
jgi:serine/threonine protein kinase